MQTTQKDEMNTSTKPIDMKEKISTAAQALRDAYASQIAADEAQGDKWIEDGMTEALWNALDREQWLGNVLRSNEAAVLDYWTREGCLPRLDPHASIVDWGGDSGGTLVRSLVPTLRTDMPHCHVWLRHLLVDHKKKADIAERLYQLAKAKVCNGVTALIGELVQLSPGRLTLRHLEQIVAAIVLATEATLDNAPQWLYDGTDPLFCVLSRLAPVGHQAAEALLVRKLQQVRPPLPNDQPAAQAWRPLGVTVPPSYVASDLSDKTADRNNARETNDE